MLLANELATTAKRAAAAGCGLVTVLSVPQPVKTSETMKIRMGTAIFLTGMSVLFS